MTDFKPCPSKPDSPCTPGRMCRRCAGPGRSLDPLTSAEQIVLDTEHATARRILLEALGHPADSGLSLPYLAGYAAAVIQEARRTDLLRITP